MPFDPFGASSWREPRRPVTGRPHRDRSKAKAARRARRAGRR